MPLYVICECCKCKESVSQDVWAISRNHKYNYSRYLCTHFNVEIDTESSIGFFGYNWRNTITVRAYYKPTGEERNVISRTFNKNSMEYQDYEKFNNKVVIHARVSDYRNKYPTCGNKIQDEIEYNEERERQRLEEIRLERQRREEMQRQYERDLELEKIKNKEIEYEEESKKDLILLKQKVCNKKKTSRLLVKKVKKIEFVLYRERNLRQNYVLLKNNR